MIFFCVSSTIAKVKSIVEDLVLPFSIQIAKKIKKSLFRFEQASLRKRIRTCKEIVEVDVKKVSEDLSDGHFNFTDPAFVVIDPTTFQTSALGELLLRKSCLHPQGLQIARIFWHRCHLHEDKITQNVSKHKRKMTKESY